MHARFSEPTHGARSPAASDRMSVGLASTILIGAGLILLWAAAAKAHEPYQARAAFSALVTEVAPASVLRLVGTNAPVLVLVLAEAALGVLLIARVRPRLTAVLFAALMGSFAIFLFGLTRLPETPSCGCLGQWPRAALNAKESAYFGIGRNLALGVAVLWCGSALAHARGAPAGDAGASIGVRRPVAGAPRGLTLLETLVTIAVIGVLIALLVPSLAGARLTSRQARLLADLRQSATAVGIYAGERADAFPTAIGPQTPDLPDLFGPDGPAIPPSSYLTRNSLDWSEPVFGEAAGDASERRPAMMTTAAFANPDVFTDNRVPLRNELRTQRLTGVRHPSAKGLLLSIDPEFWPPTDEAPRSVLAARVDGSASHRSTDPAASPIPDSLVFGPAFPVVWTRNGVHGVDFR